MTESLGNRSDSDQKEKQVFVQKRLGKAIEHLVGMHGPIRGRTRLVKLLYLADRTWKAQTGRQYTEASYYRWNHGPFAREILSTLEWMNGVELTEEAIRLPTGSVSYEYSSGGYTRLEGVSLDPKFVAILNDVATTWKKRPLPKLLDYVYGQSDFQETMMGDQLLQG